MSNIPIDGPLLLPEQTAPATPSSGKVAGPYAKANGRLYAKDDTGAETLIAPPAPIVVRRVSVYSVSELYFSPVLGVDSSEPTNGTFTAVSDNNIVLDIDVSGSNYGQASIYWNLFVEVGGSGLMYDVTGAPVDNAKVYMIGGWGGDQAGASLTARVILTQANHSTLAAGQTIRWSLIPYIIGAAFNFDCVDGPTDVCISPDNTKMWVTKFNSACVQPLTLPLAFTSLADKGYLPIAGPSIPTGTWPSRVRASNTRAYVANYFSQTVSTINALTEKWVRNSTLPATNNPNGLALKADDTILYVVTQQGNMIPITTSTGALGSTVVIGASKVLQSCVLNSAETKLFIANQTDSTVRAVTLPNTLGTAIPVGGPPLALHRAPNGYIWVLTSSATLANNVLQKIDPATETVIQTISLPKINAQSFAIGSDGMTAWVGFASGWYSEVHIDGLFSGTVATHHTGQFSVNGATYTGNVNGIAIDQEMDQIYVTLNGVDKVWMWPGSNILITPDDAFYGGRAVVTITP